jgi:uncharacterized protein YndB with AHSA1/START domain
VAEVQIEDEISVNASAVEVWQAIKDPAAHAQWHPFVTRISGEHALGAFRTCTVSVGKKSGQTKERCIADDEGRRIAWAIEEDSTGFLRLVSDWTAGFRVEPTDGAARVTAESVFAPRNVLVGLVMPLVRRKFHQTQRAILAGLKDAVERPSAFEGEGQHPLAARRGQASG